MDAQGTGEACQAPEEQEADLTTNLKTSPSPPKQAQNGPLHELHMRGERVASASLGRHQEPCRGRPVEADGTEDTRQSLRVRDAGRPEAWRPAPGQTA